MEKLMTILHRERERTRDYFSAAGAEIARSNLFLARLLSLAAASLLLLFSAAAALMLRDWSAEPPHLLLFLLSLFFYALFSLLERRELPEGQVTALCLLQELTLMSLVILIDVFPSPDAPACFTPLLVIALPAFFILPPLLNHAAVLLALAGYTAAVLAFKTPEIVRYDLFSAFASLFCSLAVSHSILHLRLRDHEIRAKYKLLSTRDLLSGILNKDTCLRSCRRYLDAVGEEVCCLLLMIDLDDFKQINDRYGHDRGDELLQMTGELLRRTFRATDIMGRFGGDEFMVLVKDAEDAALLETKCRLLQEGLSRFRVDGIAHPVSCSIGGVSLTGTAADFSAVFQQADRALYEAKRAGKGCFVLHPYRS